MSIGELEGFQTTGKEMQMFLLKFIGVTLAHQ